MKPVFCPQCRQWWEWLGVPFKVDGVRVFPTQRNRYTCQPCREAAQPSASASTTDNCLVPRQMAKKH